jgi:protein-S-isoprenylcysteine O-methyltransferase Ste14
MQAGIIIRRNIFEIAIRLMALTAGALFVHRAGLAYLSDPNRITLLLLLLSETVTFVIMLLSRRPSVRDWHPLTIVCTLGASFLYPLFIDTAPGRQLVGENAGAAIQCVGLAWAVYAKLSLGRSFGLLPARRGIVVKGAYRWVRHPMYLGYFVTHMGFLLANFSLQNLIVYSMLYAMQIYRILREEQVLSGDQAYKDYRQQVRYRAIYGVF